MKIVAVALVLSLAGTAVAQAPPGECLDPYAAAAAQPAPPPPCPAPPPPCPAPPPPPCCAPAPPACPPTAAAPSWVPPTAPAPYYQPAAPPALGRGWRLVVDERGQWVQERVRRTTNRAMLGAGLTTFLLSYFGAGISGTLQGFGWNWAPVAGPLASGIIGGFMGSPGMAIGYTFASVLQITGLVLSFASGSGKKVVERRPLMWGGWAGGGGGGLSLSGRF